MGANSKETMGFINVTPAMAADWLEHNMPNNRKVKKSVVKRYAEDMARGAWEKSYEPIVINKDGLLENGQHRLNAVILANVPVLMYVITNADSAPGTYDRGAARTIRDSLYVRNNIDRRYAQNLHIAVVNSIYSDFGIQKASDTIIEKFLENYGQLIDTIACAANQKKGSKDLCRKASIVKTLFYAVYSGYTDIDTIYNFCLVVNSGFSSSEKESAAIVMRNQLLSLSTGVFGKTHVQSWWKQESSLLLLTAAALSDFVNEKQRRNAYNIDAIRTPLFVDRAKKMLKAEITNA